MLSVVSSKGPGAWDATALHRAATRRTKEDLAMDKDRIEGKWTEIKGKLRESYGDLTDNELEQARGNREQIEGLLQQRLGKTKDDARSALDRVLEKI